MNEYEVVIKTFTTVVVEAADETHARQAALKSLGNDPDVMFGFSDNAEIDEVILLEEDVE